jgi:hypothetical protein
MSVPLAIAAGITAAAFGAATWAIWRNARRLQRAEFIRTYVLPKGLFDKLLEKRPSLEYRDCSLVARGLRQFFLAHLNSGGKFVSMPSQVVDDLWHEFILYTREYQRFCSKAFGRFLHHSPAAVLGSEKIPNEGLRVVWRQTCLEENINIFKPQRLPLLFALDAKLNIENGFRYVPDCFPLHASGDKSVHCATYLAPFKPQKPIGSLYGRGKGAGCGGGCGGGDGHGCGGGGCGGGGCGGGS